MNKKKKKPGLTFVLINLSIAASCFYLLTVAWQVQPQPAGFGSHRQLDMPKCGFLDRTGKPCPTCGMTTAFAHTVRLQWFAAFKTQPGGWLLAILAALALPLCLWQAVTGRPVEKIITWLNFYAVKILIMLAIILLAAWGYKVLTI